MNTGSRKSSVLFPDVEFPSDEISFLIEGNSKQEGMAMSSIFIKTASVLLYFYSREKRKAFRRKHSRFSRENGKLFRTGIIGEYTYVVPGSVIVDSRSRIGKFCSIAKNVSIGTTMHPLHSLTTHPVSYTGEADDLRIPPENRVDFRNKTPVRIGNDVWIGLNAVVMDGVTIGDGAVIGAGAVVTKDIPPYAIAVGMPARVIKYRFDPETVARLLKTRWWDRPREVIERLPQGDVAACLQILEALDEETAPHNGQ